MSSASVAYLMTSNGWLAKRWALAKFSSRSVSVGLDFSALVKASMDF